MDFKFVSSAFSMHGQIPVQYTCDGQDLSPPLTWAGVPSGTESLALIIDDPDAPDPNAPRMVWVHWVLYNLPPALSALPEGATMQDLPSGCREGINDWRITGYKGPCPPIGRHRYFFKLFALDMVLPDLGKPNKAALEKAMAGHILAKAELIGTYQRPV